MKDFFDDKLYWTYPDKLMLDATFGEYTTVPRGGRVEQMRQLWISILKSNTGDKDKKGVLYFHGSPGIGKTYILRELYSRKINDIPMDCKLQAEQVNFLVLDFGRGACTEICSSESRLLIRIIQISLRCPDYFGLTLHIKRILLGELLLKWCSFL